MAATNAINLYITTCRYVIRSNPYDPETWTELYRYLPYLRQSLSCCVCSQILHIPVGPLDTPCQHHVCKACVGGKMHLKPACSWCKDFSNSVENPIIRTLIQCFKKLCEYLASSAIAADIANVNNGNANAIRIVIQEGMAISDEYSSPVGTHLGLFPPKLHKVNAKPGTSHEQNSQVQIVNFDNGQGNLGGSGSFVECNNSFLEESDGVGPATKSPVSHSGSNTPSVYGQDNHRKVQHKQKLSRKKKRSSVSLKCKFRFNHENDHSVDDEAHEVENSLYETVATEHDYIKESPNSDAQNGILKVRIRKVEGDHESLVKKSRLIVEPLLPQLQKNDLIANGDVISPKSPQNYDISPSFEDQNRSKSSSNKRKQISGCRCGLATPNPGKLTCCGQRCPCYSSFKGCSDCKCRGCRNPRGDKPSPNSLKVQLQQQHLTTESLLPVTNSHPQLILTPIKMDHLQHNDLDV